MCNFTLTAEAAKQVLAAALNSNAENMFLRVTGRPDVTGAVLHGMGFDELRAGDLQIESEGVRIVITSEQAPLLEGCVLDFVRLNTGQSLFVFVNPNDQGCTNSLGSCGFCDVKCRPPLTPPSSKSIPINMEKPV
jgi:iron-sulfur cluster assembly protein